MYIYWVSLKNFSNWDLENKLIYTPLSHFVQLLYDAKDKNVIMEPFWYSWHLIYSPFVTVIDNNITFLIIHTENSRNKIRFENC